MISYWKTERNGDFVVYRAFINGIVYEFSRYGQPSDSVPARPGQAPQAVNDTSDRYG